MKRGGIALAVLLAISGVLRIAGPGSSSGSQTTGPGRGTTSMPASARAPQSTYQRKLYSTIQDFFGDWPGASTSAPGPNLHIAVPECARSEIEFVVAILPDPVHTRLGLFFDRNVEALQQAAQKQHYAFDRAILPWDRNPHSDASDPKARQEAAAEQDARESFPGLLIYRDGFDPSGKAMQVKGSPASNTAGCYLHHKPLFVFIVGETPTGGVRKKQFRNTLQILREIRGPQAAAPGVQNHSLLRILGPSFSGSLDSLASMLQEDANRPSQQAPFAAVFIYSGTVTGRSAMDRFNTEIAPQGHFASFLENDDYSLAQFILFARTEGFEPDEIAVLSEDGTEYGTPRGGDESEPADSGVIRLHFPREISYFRSAYQKEIAAQQQQASSSAQAPARSTLPLDLNESGNDDDSVPPYNVVLTTLSQESVLLGVISELQKHHIKFTVLLASNPSDQLFLARYLRAGYPQGRVVVTAPDLLLCREDDTLLHGVLGLNTYALLPGLDDTLGHYGEPSSTSQTGPHEDRLFVSSLSVGEFNAMVGLLALTQPMPGTTEEKSAETQSLLNRGFVPVAPYAEYAPPAVQYEAPADAAKEIPHRPLLWLTILGRDGYWPIVALSRDALVSTDGFEPVVSLPPKKDTPNIPTTLHESLGQLLPHKQLPSPKPLEALAQSQPHGDHSADTPPAWNLALCICLLILSLHAILSWKGSALADSESRAQFARNSKDRRAALIIAIGAFALSFAFALILLTRSVRVAWDGGWLFTTFLWVLYAAFVAVTFRDLSSWRGQPMVANIFLTSVGVMTTLQLVLWTAPENWTLVYWSNRMIHLDSGLSPVLPVLLLLAGGYWWMWMSLRAVALVDLRRPRLPEQKDLADKAADDVTRPESPDAPDLTSVSHRIGDEEAEQLREVAHPFFVKWEVMVPVIGLFLIALTVLDLKHPIQTIEGRVYDWGYTVLLCVLVGTFLGSLLKLVLSWLKCRQILAGLDRLQLRDAFGRMKDLSWHSFWNPGGSTLRETYKIMSRSLQSLQRLRPLLDAKSQTLSEDGRRYAGDQIDEVFKKREATLEKYHELFVKESLAPDAAKKPKNGFGAFLRRRWAWFNSFFVAEQNRGSKEQALMGTVEDLQRQIAKAAATVTRYVLAPFWTEEESPVVSEGKDLMDRLKLPPVRSLAEEFTALVYVNFLVSVLLRLRAFVLCAIGMYVGIVVSISVYPFEPHPALQALMVILAIVGGVAVGYVYAEMHREPLLSKLTSTNPGELGWDFWLKLVSAGAIPIFSLLAGQFPGLNKLLFSWLEPALNAVK